LRLILLRTRNHQLHHCASRKLAKNEKVEANTEKTKMAREMLCNTSRLRHDKVAAAKACF
jgi:hypothetical protein